MNKILANSLKLFVILIAILFIIKFGFIRSITLIAEFFTLTCFALLPITLPIVVILSLISFFVKNLKLENTLRVLFFAVYFGYLDLFIDGILPYMAQGTNFKIIFPALTVLIIMTTILLTCVLRKGKLFPILPFSLTVFCIIHSILKSFVGYYA